MTPIAYERQSLGQAWRARPARWRRVPALLCALASVLALALSACASTVPPNLCHWTGEAPPLITRSSLRVTPPLAADGVVYVGYAIPGTDHSPAQSAIVALRARDGASLWSTLPWRSDGVGEPPGRSVGESSMSSTAASTRSGSAMGTFCGRHQWTAPKYSPRRWWTARPSTWARAIAT
jgi:hypothetical protein